MKLGRESPDEIIFDLVLIHYQGQMHSNVICPFSFLYVKYYFKTKYRIC
jgi:hypothetical protein